MGLTTSRSNQHISQTSRSQLNFLFLKKSKTAFIKTIFSCRYVTSIKPKMYLCLNKKLCLMIHEGDENVTGCVSMFVKPIITRE
jgi:hypothetical protein